MQIFKAKYFYLKNITTWSEIKKFDERAAEVFTVDKWKQFCHPFPVVEFADKYPNVCLTKIPQS